MIDLSDYIVDVLDMREPELLPERETRLRTRDIQLGRLALYQLSYSRVPPMVPASRTGDVAAVG